MATNPPARPAFGVGLVQPRDASAYFARKKALLPSFNWDDVYGLEHAAGVAVSGIMQRDVLQMFADELQRTIDAGGDLRTFRENVKAALIKAGLWGEVQITNPATGEQRITKFDQRRLQLIFGTNVRAAQAAGQYERAMAAKGDLPYLVYLSQADERVRPLHRGWHGTALPVDHPFWATHLPPNGWNCRCRFVSANERDLARMAARGVPIKREPPGNWQMLKDHVRKGKGNEPEQTVRVPVGIDPGFDHNTALARLRGVLPQLLDMPRVPAPKLDALPRLLATPTTVAPTELLPNGLTVAEYIQAFVAAAVGEGPALGPKVLTDATGLQLVIDAELFYSGLRRAYGAALGDAGQHMRLLARTLSEPEEIWERIDTSAGKTITRRRYLARYLVQAEGGTTTAIATVVEWGPKGWSVIADQSSSLQQANQVLDPHRVGVRVYVKP